jgi:uncharacterized protein (TIGR02145 family)
MLWSGRRGTDLPSDAEWGILMKSVNLACSPTGRCDNAGKLLKAASGWNKNGNGTDDYGFAALPGGAGGGSSDDSFFNVGDYGEWWSASKNDAGYAYARYMGYNNECVLWDSNYEWRIAAN